MKFDVQWIYNTYTIVVTGIIDYNHALANMCQEPVHANCGKFANGYIYIDLLVMLKKSTRLTVISTFQQRIHNAHIQRIATIATLLQIIMSKGHQIILFTTNLVKDGK